VGLACLKPNCYSYVCFLLFHVGFVCRSLWLPRGHRYDVAVSIFHCTSSANILKHHRVGKNIIPVVVSVLLAAVISTVLHGNRSATANTSRQCLLLNSDILNLFLCSCSSTLSRLLLQQLFNRLFLHLKPSCFYVPLCFTFKSLLHFAHKINLHTPSACLPNSHYFPPTSPTDWPS